jgi:hypothetical protein
MVQRAMRRFRTDKRSRKVVASPDAAKAAEEAATVLGPNEIKGALGLATIEQNRSYILEKLVSVQAWAKSRGYEEQQANRLLALGRVLLAEPALLKRVREGKVTRENAVTLGRVLRELKPKGEDKKVWLDGAEKHSTKELRSQVEKAIEDSKQGEATLPMRLRVTKAAKDGFHRARHLMSRGEPRMITEGQTFGRLVEYWRDRHDPRCKNKPKRHRGPTKGTRDRYVPRQVVWAVERRSEGTCEICGVRRARHKIHLKTPHARGGGREEEDLGHACPDCHFFVDCGVILFEGFDRQGRLRWRFHPEALPEQPGEDPPQVREPEVCYAGCAIPPGEMIPGEVPVPYG